MAEINDFNTTDSSNTDRFPEGMAPSAVNDGMRADEGILARFYQDNNGSLVTAGTSTAYTVTLNSQHSAWFDGLTFTVRFDEACGDDATINPTGSAALGAKSLAHNDGTAVAANDIPANAVVQLQYNSTTGKVHIIGFPGILPIGNLLVASAAQGDILYHNGTKFTRLGAGTSGQYLKTQGAAANPTWATVSTTNVTAGTALVLNPISTGASSSQAHGLGAAPTFLVAEMECLTADANYAVGDKVRTDLNMKNTASGSFWSLIVDATNVAIRTGTGGLNIVDKSSGGNSNITLSRWKLTVTPYLAS